MTTSKRAVQTLTTIAFDTKMFDGLTEFDLNTHKFTAQVAGYYNITAQILWTNPVVGKTFVLYLQSDSDMAICQHTASGTNGFAQTVSKLFHLQAGESVYVQVQHDDSTNKTIAGGSPETYFCAHRLS
jgi:hypothetical protein